jgi:hypothetical protein
MSERDSYSNLPSDVSIHHCNSSSVMPAEVGPRAAELKQLWIHDDAEETEASKELDGNTMFLVCPHCKFHYSVYLGD